METQTQTDLKNTVKAKYGEAATRAATGAQAIGCCGSPTGCGGPDPITSNLYDLDQQAGLPGAAVAASLGCGNPTALAELKRRARRCSTSARAAASTCCCRPSASARPARPTAST